MIVIGGFNSANTCRLAEICREIQPKTYHIETANEIDDSWFQEVEAVGVTAGASTPKWIIDAVMDRLGQVNNSH
jgi:4-hydroxy-3-methylbut-2-enyl diphosphate reductase